jgi:lysozyme
MTPDSRKKLKDLILKHENYKQFAYTDTTGHVTIGIGRNLTENGISLNEALYMLDDDIQYFSSKLSHVYPAFDTLCEPRQIVLIDMCFNLGINGLLEFKDMLAALSDCNYSAAADAMKASKWYEQTGQRGEQDEQIMRTGEI